MEERLFKLIDSVILILIGLVYFLCGLVAEAGRPLGTSGSFRSGVLHGSGGLFGLWGSDDLFPVRWAVPLPILFALFFSSWCILGLAFFVFFFVFYW